MIDIDGSYGEGGGQILRSAVSLSVLLDEPVHVYNIRANRPNPGIRPQHYTVVEILKELCNARVEGLDVGSSCISFFPGEIKGGFYIYDIGTAGSIVLVFQACIMSLLRSGSMVRLRLRGGTDVKWAPGWDFFNFVFLKNLRRMGVVVDTKLVNRGYYPKGGGEAEIVLKPVDKIMPFFCDNSLDFNRVDGIVHLCNLPDHVGSRMKHAAIKRLVSKGFESSISIDKCDSLSMGTGITLWSESDGFVLGSLGLGERGVPAERVGEIAADNLMDEISSGACLDVFCFDQLLVYMAIASGISDCLVKGVSSHASTNMWLVSRFFDDGDIFSVDDIDDVKKIKINGLG